MTELNRPVKRRTQTRYRNLKQKRLIITIAPSERGDFISLREEGRRKAIELPFDKIYILAMRAEADAKLAEKRQKRKDKRKERRRNG